MNFDNFKKKIERENKLHNYDGLDEKTKERVIQIDYEAENMLRMHSRCIMYSVKYTAIGILIGMPISISRRSYYPFIITGSIGTAADYFDSKNRCKPYQQMLDLLYDEKDKILGIVTPPNKRQPTL